MSNYGPIARIILRYGAGAVLGAEAGNMLAGDPDIVSVVSATLAFVVGAGTEVAYRVAKKNGWST